MIYLDNAATTKIDDIALEAMRPFLSDYANASSPYSFSRGARKAIKEAKELIAECIGAYPDEIYFTSGGTESDNWALRCAQNGGRRGVLITKAEHHAVLNCCGMLEKEGEPVKYLNVDKTGAVVLEELKENTGGVRLVSVMTANNEVGTISPVREAAEIAHGGGALFHTDAVQAIGHIKINVKDLGADLLSASAHKFNGPKGVGFLYIKRGIEIIPLIAGGAQQSGLRSGTENVAGVAAMAAALKSNADSLTENAEKLNLLEKIFIDTLNRSHIDYIRNGGANRLPGSVSISIKGADGERLLHRMDLKGILISTGAACSAGETKISHVILAIGVPDQYAYGTVRITFGKYNSEKEAHIAAQTLADIIKS